VTAPLDRPLRRDASRNRDRLLQAARELFAERGLDVPMDDIADRAGVGVGTAYRRFANRDEIIDALFEDRMADYVALAEAALAEPDPWAGLVTFLERSLAVQAADRGLKELLMRDRRTLDRVASARKRLLPLLGRIVARAHEAGVLRPGVTADDVGMLSHMLGTTADFAPDLWRRYLPLVLDGLRAGAPLPGEPLTDPLRASR
jgi:AcrR family transcriptional regulator